MKNDINLIELKEEHLEMVRTWRQSEEVSKYMYTSPSLSIEQQLEWFRRVEQDNSKEHYIIQHNGKDLGLASITEINFTFKKCQWAFYLGDTSIRGQGIGAKVEFNIIKRVFDNLKLNRLECEVFVFNDKVIKMHEKFGFRREGYFREYIYKDGKFLDVVALALLKNDWKRIEENLFNKIYRR